MMAINSIETKADAWCSFLSINTDCQLTRLQIARRQLLTPAGIFQHFHSDFDCFWAWLGWIFSLTVNWSIFISERICGTSLSIRLQSFLKIAYGLCFSKNIFPNASISWGGISSRVTCRPILGQIYWHRCEGKLVVTLASSSRESEQPSHTLNWWARLAYPLKCNFGRENGCNIPLLILVELYCVEKTRDTSTKNAKTKVSFEKSHVTRPTQVKFWSQYRIAPGGGHLPWENQRWWGNQTASCNDQSVIFKLQLFKPFGSNG